MLTMIPIQQLDTIPILPLSLTEMNVNLCNTTTLKLEGVSIFHLNLMQLFLFNDVSPWLCEEATLRVLRANCVKHMFPIGQFWKFHPAIIDFLFIREIGVPNFYLTHKNWLPAQFFFSFMERFYRFAYVLLIRLNFMMHVPFEMDWLYHLVIGVMMTRKFVEPYRYFRNFIYIAFTFVCDQVE